MVNAQNKLWIILKKDRLNHLFDVVIYSTLEAASLYGSQDDLKRYYTNTHKQNFKRLKCDLEKKGLIVFHLWPEEADIMCTLLFFDDRLQTPVITHSRL